MARMGSSQDISCLIRAPMLAGSLFQVQQLSHRPAYAPLHIALTPIVPYYRQTIAILVEKHRRCAMQRSTLVQLTVGIYIASLMVLAAVLPSEAQVRRLVFASAGLNESNRFWTIPRPSHLQYDPFLETLLDLDPETGAYIPRLAEKWEATPDLKEWTFFLRKGVPFHFGYGEFTARDVVHSHSLMLRPEAIATLTGFWS